MIDIRPMTIDDVDGVSEVENICFQVPWTKDDFRREIEENKMAIYYVADYQKKIIGFAGMWHVINEGQITNIAVIPEYRKCGCAKRLLEVLIKKGRMLNMIGITLEVAVGNEIAKKLYEKLGFVPEGIRKGYYEHIKEDAIIMWKHFDIDYGLDEGA